MKAMPIACPSCSSEEIELVERLGAYERKLRCESCGQEWLRHAQAVSPKDQAANDDATRRRASKGRAWRADRPPARRPGP
jgi:hypothetical protein